MTVGEEFWDEMTTRSWTLELLPIEIEPASPENKINSEQEEFFPRNLLPLKTQEYQTDELWPILTSPTTDALGATKAWPT